MLYLISNRLIWIWSYYIWIWRPFMKNSKWFYIWVCVHAQSGLILHDFMACSPLGSCVHGILQTRILEWVAISFSRGDLSTQGLNPYLLHLLHWQADSLSLSHLGSPFYICSIHIHSKLITCYFNMQSTDEQWWPCFWFSHSYIQQRFCLHIW